MRLVLVPPVTKDPDPAVAGDLANVDLETAAVLLVHLAADALTQERRDGEPRLGLTSESLGMEVIANSLFNERDDVGDMLARYRLLWTDYGNRLKAAPARLTPVALLSEATGLDLDDITALGFAYYSHILAHRPVNPVAVKALIHPDLPIEAATIERFLGLFSATAEELAAALVDCRQPWQMLPIQDRPLLRTGDDVIVLDERYLIERITRGLYWLVHDHEKLHHGEDARRQWTQAYGEMVETRAEDQLHRLAPHLFGAGSAFFTEENLRAAFPGTKNCDAGIDFGSEVVLAEVVSGTVTVGTREQASVDAFRSDTEKIVMKKARQLDVTARNLLRNPQPAKSPLVGPARRIYPIAVCGGQYPVNPVTLSYINEQIAAEGLLADGRIQQLRLLDFDELEDCEALHQHRGVAVSRLLADWLESEYHEASFRSYLWSRYGGQDIGRPDDMRDALAASVSAMWQRLDFGDGSSDQG